MDRLGRPPVFNVELTVALDEWGILRKAIGSAGLSDSILPPLGELGLPLESDPEEVRNTEISPTNRRVLHTKLGEMPAISAVKGDVRQLLAEDSSLAEGGSPAHVATYAWNNLWLTGYAESEQAVLAKLRYHQSKGEAYLDVMSLANYIQRVQQRRQTGTDPELNRLLPYRVSARSYKVWQALVKKALPELDGSHPAIPTQRTH